MSEYSLKSIFAPLPALTRGRGFKLNADPKNEKIVYCSGPAVIVRDLKNPTDCYTYTEHQGTPTAACFAPSGFYIASGDTRGTVRVWDTTQETHGLKYECPALGGAVRDICWSPDNKRILLGGDGRQSRTRCFMWDSGSSCGTLAGHMKTVNAVAHNSGRPFRAVTASEDFQVNFHTGVPYNSIKNINEHSNFVNSARFSPNGEVFVTVSSDKRALVFNGKDGDFIGEFKEGDTAHPSSVMDVSFKSDGTQAITASVDKTVRLWDLETRKCITTIQFGNEIDDQQLGCLWAGEYVLSVSLSGAIKYIDLNSSTIRQSLTGHFKSIETMEVSGKKIYTSSFDGRSMEWDSDSGEGKYFTGAVTKVKIMDAKVSGDQLVVADMNNKITRTPLSTREMGSDTSGLPDKNCSFMGVHAGTGVEIYVCGMEIVMFKNGSQVFSLPLKYEGHGCAVSPCGTKLVVGAKTDPALYIYDIGSSSIVQNDKIDTAHSCTEITFSPDGKWLAGASAGRSPVLLKVESGFNFLTHGWSAQSKTLTCCFSPDSSRAAFAGIDNNILICKLDAPMKAPLKILKAHPLGTINRVRWLDDNTLISTGSDCQIRKFAV